MLSLVGAVEFENPGVYPVKAGQETGEGTTQDPNISSISSYINGSSSSISVGNLSF